MFKLLGQLKGYLKHQEISTDSMVFRMHNEFTAVLLLTCSMIITASQFVGNPISCIVPSALPTQPVNTFCWITSTFTMPDAFKRQVLIIIVNYLLYPLSAVGCATLPLKRRGICRKIESFSLSISKNELQDCTQTFQTCFVATLERPIFVV